jgi:DNA adenine methylase
METSINTNISNLEKEKSYLSKYLKKITSSTRTNAHSSTDTSAKQGVTATPGPTFYKRVALSPLRYAGGKSNAIGYILENLPALRQKKIVSPFFGGGSVELVLCKELGFEVVGYDVFSELVNFWNVILHSPQDLASQLEKLVPDAENFTLNRHILLNYWEKIKPPTLKYNTKQKIELTEQQKNMLDTSPLLRATYYYYNMQLSYGPMFLGWGSSVYLHDTKYKKIIENVKKFKCEGLSVSCDDFSNVIRRHGDDFLFLDPPYYLGKDSKMFKGMYPNCNFAIHHEGFDHELLCQLLKEHKGGFMITYNDCETIREWYKDYKQVFPKWQYTYGQGEKRIGKNREETKTNKKESHEIIIICPPY